MGNFAVRINLLHLSDTVKFIAPQPVPTHIISGFLGAGKTTLLQHLLNQKPEHEVWAVLMNEFGQIALEQWHKLSDRFPTIDLDAFVVMPNHVHEIIMIHETVGAYGQKPLPIRQSPGIGKF